MLPKREDLDGNRAQARDQFAGARGDRYGIADPLGVIARKERLGFALGDGRNDLLGCKRRPKRSRRLPLKGFVAVNAA